MQKTRLNKVEYLLAELCTTLGYCNANRDIASFEALVPSGPDAFADAVLFAESPDVEGVHATEDVRRLVARHFRLWAERSTS
jgi:hypothetical protein